MIGAVAVLTPVVTGLIGVGGRIGGVLGAAMPTRGVLGAAMARGMPGAAMSLTTGGVPGAIDDNQTAVGGLLGWPIVTIKPQSRACLAGQSCQSTRGRGVAWLASRDNNNQPAVAGLLGWAMVCHA